VKFDCVIAVHSVFLPVKRNLAHYCEGRRFEHIVPCEAGGIRNLQNRTRQLYRHVKITGHADLQEVNFSSRYRPDNTPLGVRTSCLM